MVVALERSHATSLLKFFISDQLPAQIHSRLPKNLLGEQVGEGSRNPK